MREEKRTWLRFYTIIHKCCVSSEMQLFPHIYWQQLETTAGLEKTFPSNSKAAKQ